MELVGQVAAQAPQPMQRSASNCGSERPPVCNRKRIAWASHWSSQVRHVTPFDDRQLSVALARQFQPSAGSIAPVSQTTAQVEQNVQAPAVKSTFGRPSWSLTIMASGQASMQSPHFVQASSKASGVSDPGGRIAKGRFILPFKKARRSGSCCINLAPFWRGIRKTSALEQ